MLGIAGALFYAKCCHVVSSACAYMSVLSKMSLAINLVIMVTIIFRHLHATPLVHRPELSAFASIDVYAGP